MKKSIIVILVLAAVLVFWGFGIYNGLVTAEEKVSKQWANVETQYQRRADLIPNLVATVKGYATHESETLEAVVNARAKATQTTIDANSLTAENLQEFQAAQNQVNSALGRLLAVAESYPDLKANQNFIELQAQLEGTENRIAVQRQEFNNVVNEYNNKIKRMPARLFASMFGFKEKPYFKADAGSNTAPKVEF